MRGTFGAAILLAVLVGLPAVAQDGSSLSIGDRVPEIQISHYLKGGAIDAALDGNKTYVLEFWATW